MNENLQTGTKPATRWVSAERKKALMYIIYNKDKDGLHEWIQANLKAYIPRVAICPTHCAPFDFVADYIFNNFLDAILLANRSGGKTFNFAIIDTILTWLYEAVEVATVGAIEAQALRCYNYYKGFNDLYPFSENVLSSTMRSTSLKNKSDMAVIIGTMSGTNSPHPQFNFLDEIDLMNAQVLNQAMSMPQSKPGIQARTVLTSTRKFAGGVMQKMLDNADAAGMKKYEYCIWEVVEGLPAKDTPLYREIKKLFGATLPERITQADGYYSWQDVVQKYKYYKINDPDVWESEWLCRKPGLEGVIYGTSFNDDNNLISDTWVPTGDGYLYLFEDFGFGKDHPNVVLFAWIPVAFDRVIIFDELYLEGFDTDGIWHEIENTLGKYGMDMPRLGYSGNVTGWVGDPHGLTELADRISRGAPIMDKNPDAKLYIINNRIPIMKKWLSSGKLMISGRCTQFRTELLSYKRMKNKDGTWSTTPEKRNDHGPDACGYGLVVLDPLLADSTFGMMNEEPEEDIFRIKPRKKQEVEPNDDFSDGKTITSGLIDKKF